VSAPWANDPEAWMENAAAEVSHEFMRRRGLLEYTPDWSNPRVARCWDVDAVPLYTPMSYAPVGVAGAYDFFAPRARWVSDRGRA
jgi:hypothetical protein